MYKSIELLYDLGRGADLAAEFHREPERVISRYGLSDEQGDAVKMAEPEAICHSAGLPSARMTNRTVDLYA